MRTLTCLIAGAVASAALTPVAIAAPGDDIAWDIVPDQTLQTMRGGVDLGPSGLVGYFAIDRVVEIDGQVVARMQIVISNLDNLASGAMPSISVSGLTPTLIQILNGQQGLSTAATNALLSSVSSTPAAATSAKAANATAAAPSGVDSNTAPTPPTSAAAVPATDQGKIASNNIQSGSTAQFGTALTNALNAATGALGSSSPVTSNNSNAGNGTAAAVPATATSSAPTAQTASPITVQPIAAQNGTNSSGAAPIVLVSNLPNATAITTAVQNEVQAATIQIRTTISATLNSLSALNSLTLASAIRTQVAAGLP